MNMIARHIPIVLAAVLFMRRVRRSFTCLILAAIVLLAGCSDSDSGDSDAPATNTPPASLPVPERVQAKINNDASNVSAMISIDGGTEQAMTISDGAATFQVAELAPGSHDIVITFYQVAGDQRIELAQYSSQINIVAGQTTTLGQSDIVYNTDFDQDGDDIQNVDDEDNDNDGLLDEHEVAYGWNPFHEDSDGDGTNDGDELPGLAITTPVPASVLEKIATDGVSVAASITVDDSAEQVMSIDDGNAAYDVLSLLPGEHAIVITFYQVAGSERIVLARHTAAVNVVAGQPATFGDGELVYDTAFDNDADEVQNIADTDNDQDGISDAAEPGYEKNPFNADSDGDDIPDADEIAVQVSGRGDHTCIVLFSGKVRCWGYNWDGELGNGESADNLISFVPVATNGITNAISVHTSSFHSCARLSGGQVRCWGSNEFEEIASETVDSTSPVEVANLAGASDLQLTTGVTCGIVADNALDCIGDVTGLTPNAIAQYFGDETLSAGTGEDHGCIVRPAGTVSCFGNYISGQLGDDNVLLPPLGPTTVLEISTATKVAVGSNHSCALLQNGTVRCWGANGESQIGDGTTVSRHSPVSVGTVSDVTALAVGADHNCALLESGNVRCWGANAAHGQLGNGSEEDAGDPVLVSGISNAISISAGQSHSCAVLANGRVQCWGSNSNGQLGSGQAPGDLPLSRTPVFVSGF